jgi:hypothetical protein
MDALYLLSYGSMAPQVGLEPTTNRLTADCSTTELLRNDYRLNLKQISLGSCGHSLNHIIFQDKT